MMDLEIQVDIRKSFYDKMDDKIYDQIITNSLKEIGGELKEACESECPVDTGRLRDGHYLNETQNQITVANNVEYATYVINGTSKQSPNNYPQRAYYKISPRVLSIILKNVAENIPK